MSYRVQGMFGLGDNIYSRPFIRELVTRDPVFLRTPWPELYRDIPGIEFVRPDTTLRTQAKNVNRQDERVWTRKRIPRQATELSISYSGIKKSTLMAGLERTFRVPPRGLLDLPSFDPPAELRGVKGPIALVRPVTERKEWLARTRNPLPEYVIVAAERLQRAGYLVVSVADLHEGQEWLVGDLPPADIRFDRGQLKVTEMLGLVRASTAAVGAIGWLLPAAMAFRTPALIVAGGSGGWNSPSFLVDSKAMDDRLIRWAVPDPYCMCSTHVHACNKVIPGFIDQLECWIDGLPYSRKDSSDHRSQPAA